LSSVISQFAESSWREVPSASSGRLEGRLQRPDRVGIVMEMPDFGEEYGDDACQIAKGWRILTSLWHQRPMPLFDPQEEET